MYIDNSSYKLEQSRGKIALDVRFGKSKMKNEKGSGGSKGIGGMLYGTEIGFIWLCREVYLEKNRVRLETSG